MRAWLPMLAVLASAAGAQPRPALRVDGAELAWLRVVASPNDDWINDLVTLANGNLMAVGFVDRRDGDPKADWKATAIELRADGAVVSDRRHGEGSGIDAFWSMIEGVGGQRMFAGFTTRIGSGGIDALAVTAAKDGRPVGERAYGGAGYDRFTDLTQAGDGFLFVGHSQAPGSELRRIYLVRTDGAAAPIWQRTFGGPESWGALYVEPSGDGGFIVAGGVSAPDSDGDMFVLKVDADGRELWRKRVGTADWDEINHGLVVRSDGTIVLVGYTHQRGSEANDLVAATLAGTGELLRLERWGGAGDDRAILAKLDSGGRIWVVGQTASAGAGGSDLLLTSLAADGAFTGQAIVAGGPGDDHGTAVLPLGDGSVAVAGYSENLGRGGEDAFVIRLSRPAADARAGFRRTVVRPAR